MSTQTTRLKLYKYQTTDAADLTATNQNSDTLDASVLIGQSVVSSHVTATTAQTVMSFAVSSTAAGLYEARLTFFIGNGVSGNNVSAYATWVDPNTGASFQYQYFEMRRAASALASAAWTEANGATSFANDLWSGAPILINAKASTNIVLTFQDPTNTPSDYVSASILRVS